ncbi:ubiquitin carboxyl-terminal hydrolase CYLD isoform X2 [Anguilla rostrata]|uniref:ubiquitin carboxyl-terminal hydrolase CYLD isoform X2 n=1 Tax=Anguilla rostrata TaxID=7938 RepID=UPI0030D5CEDE
MEPSENYTYFIIEDGYRSGRICYTEKDQYFKKKSDSSYILRVKALGHQETSVQFKEIKQLTKQEAEFLYALESDKERLAAFWEREGLDLAPTLRQSSQVAVKVNEEWCQGVVRYIGGITRTKYSDPITGTFFGIELQGNDKGKGLCDGKFGSERHFTCSKNCGIFAPFTIVRPRDPKPQESPKPLQDPAGTLVLGDRVTFFLNDDSSRNGMVLALEGNVVVISPDLNDKNDSADFVRIPLEAVIREELLSPAGPSVKTQPDTTDPSAGMARDIERSSDVLGLNSVVEVDLSQGRTVYGTVRWIGKLPGQEGTILGLELEEPSGVTDGTFSGQRMFTCLPKRGLFMKRDSCRPDSRFHTPSHREGALSRSMSNKHMERNGVLDSTVSGSVAPLSSEQVLQVLVGRMRGIQGHCNSCYMDSALFSLFSCSSTLDSLLFMSTHQQDAAVQTTLLQQIVNPLRSKGFVPSENVMKLRRQLQDGGHSDHTFTTEEKDPEEFLTLVMQRILCLEPLLKLSAGDKVQENYCYQIFLDQKHSLILPTVQQLLEHSLHWSGLTLAEIPSCLILQMPRFGKKFKLFDKIIPSLELDISDLLSESPRECVLCGQLAGLECTDCFTDPTFGRTGFKQFCRTCSAQVHSHPQRKLHRPSDLRLPEGYPPSGARQWGPPREKLQLFAVLCIETSHYVSFVRYGPRPGDWLFFDSMADRVGDQDGYNIPQVQLCPEVERYLQMSPAELATQVPREMEGVAKRLFCDAYMYLYQSPSMALYR